MPGRTQVGGSLLNNIYKTKMKRNKKKLLREAEAFGISFLGDGVTVKRIPLINCIGSSLNLAASVLEINYLLSNMVAGGKKEAP